MCSACAKATRLVVSNMLKDNRLRSFILSLVQEEREQMLVLPYGDISSKRNTQVHTIGMSVGEYNNESRTDMSDIRLELQGYTPLDQLRML